MVRAGAGHRCGACCRRAPSFRALKPAVVVGFGGYPSLPALLAAISQGRPHRDPRAERGDGPRQPPAGAAASRAVACAFPTLQKAPAAVAARAVVVGNPVRPDDPGALRPALRAAGRDRSACWSPAAARARGCCPRLVPAAVAALPEALRAAAEGAAADPARVDRARPARPTPTPMVEAEIAPFFRDMAERLADGPPGDRPRRRLDGLRDRRRRPPVDPGAAEDRPRRRPGPERRACWPRPAAPRCCARTQLTVESLAGAAAGADRRPGPPRRDGRRRPRGRQARRRRPPGRPGGEDRRLTYIKAPDLHQRMQPSVCARMDRFTGGAT